MAITVKYLHLVVTSLRQYGRKKLMLMLTAERLVRRLAQAGRLPTATAHKIVGWIIQQCENQISVSRDSIVTLGPS